MAAAGLFVPRIQQKYAGNGATTTTSRVVHLHIDLPAAASYYSEQQQLQVDTTTTMGTSGNSNGCSSGITDEDLIASLASFGVEGQTERDLATIKTMMMQQQQQQQQQQYASGGGWYMHQAAGQPPPNTPTLSKSMELYNSVNTGGMLLPPGFQTGNGSNSNSNNGYWPESSAGRRRDVSLDRSYLNNLHQHGSTFASSSTASASDSEAGTQHVQMQMDNNNGTSSLGFNERNALSIASNGSSSNSNDRIHHFQRTQSHARSTSVSMATPMEEIEEESNSGEEEVPSKSSAYSNSNAQDYHHSISSPPLTALNSERSRNSFSPPQLGDSNPNDRNSPVTRSRSRAIAAASAASSNGRY